MEISKQMCAIIALLLEINTAAFQAALGGTNLFQTPLEPLPIQSELKLPPGVPRTVNTNNEVIYVDESFTTTAFQKEALHLVMKEAERVAAQLNLREDMPITESDIREYFVGPFGFSYTENKLGNITTKHYMYGVEQRFKFSELVIADYEEVCRALCSTNVSPVSEFDTNVPYALAMRWLSDVKVDVKTMNHECKILIKPSELFNGVWRREKPIQKTFIPIYDVIWLSPTNQRNGYGAVAQVELFSPTRTLLFLKVFDAKYILRSPCTFTNLNDLFPGVAPVYTYMPPANRNTNVIHVH